MIIEIDPHVDNDPNLTQEDARLDFELRRLAAENADVPDAEVSFERFKEERLGLGKLNARRIPLWTWITAVAAIIFVFAVFTWQKPFSPSQGEEMRSAQMTDPQCTDTVYRASASMKEITLSVGKQFVPLKSVLAQQKGVTVGDDDMIRILTPQNVRPEDRTTLTIPQGKTAKVMLPDGSKVWLSACSRLIFPQAFPGNAPRVVRLIGEAFFDVVHDERRPFIVHSGDIRTKVLGTQFDIRSFDDETPSVTLVNGSVMCETDHSKSVILKPGQQAFLPLQGADFNVGNADLDAVLSWKNGEFYFENQTLKDVLTEIGRWYNVNVMFLSSDHLDDLLHYTADRSWPVRQVILQLNQICETKIRMEDNNLIVE